MRGLAAPRREAAHPDQRGGGEANPEGESEAVRGSPERGRGARRAADRDDEGFPPLLEIMRRAIAPALSSETAQCARSSI